MWVGILFEAFDMKDDWIVEEWNPASDGKQLRAQECIWGKGDRDGMGTASSALFCWHP